MGLPPHLPSPGSELGPHQDFSLIDVITLDRPKANAIDVATSLELYAAFKTLNDDPALRVGVITGTGRFFSAGWDLGAANDGEAVDADHGPGGFAGLTELWDLDKPVIAAVNGLGTTLNGKYTTVKAAFD